MPRRTLAPEWANRGLALTLLTAPAQVETLYLPITSWAATDSVAFEEGDS